MSQSSVQRRSKNSAISNPEAPARRRRSMVISANSSLARRAFISLAIVGFALGGAVGCRKELETAYGQRSGPGATKSVNGTAVFADMFQAAGHQVSSWTSLSPRLDQADCIVWFPNDFDPPSPKVASWFE